MLTTHKLPYGTGKPVPKPPATLAYQSQMKEKYNFRTIRTRAPILKMTRCCREIFSNLKLLHEPKNTFSPISSGLKRSRRYQGCRLLQRGISNAIYKVHQENPCSEERKILSRSTK